MLKVFRDNLKHLSWVLWAVILVFVVLMFTDYGSTTTGNQPLPVSAAAVVGDGEVSYEQFENAYRQVETQYRQSYGDQFSRELANQLGLPINVLNQLVDQKILMQEADRMGLVVTDEELRRAIVEMPVFQEDGRFIGEEAYNNLLRNNRLRPSEFENSLREDLITQKVRNTLSQTVFVATAEVEEAYREGAETATVRYLRVPAAKYATDVTIDDTNLGAYFLEHQESYRLSERRVVDYLVVQPAALAASIEITDAEIQAYYDTNQAEFESDEQVKARHILLRTGEQRSLDEARAELEAAKRRIEGGEDFAQLAGELSDDPGSKVKGGDLGFFGRGAMVKAFEDAAFGAELGELVGPVESAFGVHLILVQAKRPGGLQPLEEVADGIRSRLSNERANEAAEAKARELAPMLAGTDREALATTVAEHTGATFATSEPFGREDNVPGIGRGTEFTVQAFEVETGGVSEVFRTARGWTALALHEVQEPRLPELDEVRAEVANDYRQERQLELAYDAVSGARARLSDGATLDEIATEFEVELADAGPFGKTGAIGALGQAPEIARQAMALDAGAISDPIVRDADVVLFEVTERTHFDPLAFATEKSGVRANLVDQRVGELLQSFLAKRRDELGVTIDPRVFEAFSPTNQGLS